MGNSCKSKPAAVVVDDHQWMEDLHKHRREEKDTLREMIKDKSDWAAVVKQAERLHRQDQKRIRGRKTKDDAVGVYSVNLLTMSIGADEDSKALQNWRRKRSVRNEPMQEQGVPTNTLTASSSSSV